MSARVVFLLGVAGAILHLSALQIVFIFIGYFACTALDQWLTIRRRSKALDRVVDDETTGWKPDPQDPHYEVKGNWCRRKLPQEEQIVVTRVAELLRRALVGVSVF